MAATAKTSIEAPLTEELSAPLGSDVEDLLSALANASKTLDAQQVFISRLSTLVTDLASRLYILEMNMNLRPSGALNIDGLRFVGGASKSTYLNVFRRIRMEQLGLADD